MENTTLLDHYSRVEHYLPDGTVNRVQVNDEPPLWADCRPALREVLKEYHASEQRSIWTFAGKIYAMLLGGDGGPGAFDDGQITASLFLAYPHAS